MSEDNGLPGDEGEPLEIRRIEVFANPEPVVEGVGKFIGEQLEKLQAMLKETESSLRASAEMLRCAIAADARLEAGIEALRRGVGAFDPMVGGSVEPWKRDAPREMMRRQIEVCAREIGPTAMLDRFVTLTKHGLMRVLSGGSEVPYIESDELDRLYVMVRMVQFDLDHDSEDVEWVRKASRERSLDRLMVLAEDQTKEW